MDSQRRSRLPGHLHPTRCRWTDLKRQPPDQGRDLIVEEGLMCSMLGQASTYTSGLLLPEASPVPSPWLCGYNQHLHAGPNGQQTGTRVGNSNRRSWVWWPSACGTRHAGMRSRSQPPGSAVVLGWLLGMMEAIARICESSCGLSKEYG